MNRLWDIVMANEAATRSLTLLGAMPADARPPNALRMIFHPDGLRPCIVDWEEVARMTLARAHREALAAPGDPAVTALIEEMLSYPGVGGAGDVREGAEAGAVLRPPDVQEALEDPAQPRPLIVAENLGV